MKSLNQFGLLFLLTSSAIDISAQVGNVKTKNYTQPEKLRFEHITVDQGLSDNNAICILQDRKGYMWFGTWNGLNRYDGYTITNYYNDPRDSNSISFNVIYTFFEDGEGIIWIAVAGSDFSTFDRATEKFSRFKSNPAGDRPIQLTNLRAINEDKAGIIWAGNTTGELGRFDKKSCKFLKWNYSEIAFTNETDISKRNPSISKIFKDRSDNLWIGSNNGLFQLNLIMVDPGKPSEVRLTQYKHDPKDQNSLTSNQISAIYEDKDGILWIGTEVGLNRFDKAKGLFTRFVHDPLIPNSLSNNRVSGIAEDKLGNLWIGTRNGLNKLGKNQNWFLHYFHDPGDPASLGSNLIYSLLIDRSGILWLATLGGGINKVDLNQNPILLFRNNPFNKNSLSNSKVTAIGEDRFGTIWIGTAGGGLNALDKKSKNFTHFRNNPHDSNTLGSDQVSAILEDREGNLWIGGGKNGDVAVLSRLDQKTGRFTNYRFKHSYRGPPSGNPLLTIYEDRYNQLWVGTTDGYIQFDKKTGKSKPFHHDPKNSEGISDFWVNCIYEDKNGYIWLGPNSNDMNRLDPVTGKVKHYKHDPRDSTSISSGIVKSIFEDSKGNVWFATRSGGLCLVDTDKETFTTFTKREGLPSNTIYSVLEDDAGYLWLTTNNGLSRFSFTTRTINNFDIDDGLQSNQFEAEVGSAGACFKGRDGTLYFGGPNGLNAFNPYDLKFNDEIPSVVINQFKLFDRIITGKNEADTIVLKHNENFFSFEFTALNFINSFKNQYAYQLKGLDKDWIYSGTRRFASYTNIYPGHYTFMVKGSNNDGVWNETGASIYIIILSPWWKTLWFYGLCAASIALISYWLFRYRLQQKLKIFQIRNRLHRDLHDDVGATLSSVKAYSEILQTNPDNPIISGLIKENASNMIDRLEVISWATNPQHDKFKSLTDIMLKYARPVSYAHHIELQFEKDGIDDDLVIPGEIRQNIFLIFKEAINNMIKYANASQCCVAFLVKNQKFILIVNDDGDGFDGVIKGGGSGLKNIHKRAAEMHGKIEIETTLRKGTSLQLSMPYPFKNTKLMV